MLRLSDVSEGVNTVVVHAQGLSVSRGCLFRVAHGYTSGAGVERQQQTAKYQYINFHP